MFKSVYDWMAVYNSPRFSSFMEFLDLYFLFLSLIWDLLVYFLYAWVAILCSLNEIYLFILKKKIEKK